MKKKKHYHKSDKYYNKPDKYYNKSDNSVTIRRHYILLLIKILKSVFIILVAFFLYFIYTKFLKDMDNNLTVFIHYTSFLIIFSLLNYAFIKLILSIIEYYHSLIIITDEQIIIISCSLLMKDYIESIDAYRIMKIDVFARGFFSNVIGYGNLVIEQQKDEVRIFHFIPNPYKIFGLIKEHKKKVFEGINSKIVYTDPVNKKGTKKRRNIIGGVVENIKKIIKK